MQGQRVDITPGVGNFNPRVLSYILDAGPKDIPKPTDVNALLRINQIFAYDSELLDNRLASFRINDIQTGNIPKIVSQISDRQNELAYGSGVEATIRKIFAPRRTKSQPFESETRRYDNPGDIWVLTSEHSEDLGEHEPTNPTTTYGLMPLSNAKFCIDEEKKRRRKNPKISNQFEIEEVVILPKTISEYTKRLQSATRRSISMNQPLDITDFRNQYFGLDPTNPDMTGIFRDIKQEYLGDTTWSTVLFTEVLIRSADYILGLVPIAGSLWDFAQGTTGKEIPIPFVERMLREKLLENNLTLPEGIFDKPIKGRLMEILDTIIGLAPIIIPPAWLAKVPMDTIIEAALYIDKMQHTQKSFTPFLQIAEETGTKPPVFGKIEEISKSTPALLKSTWNSITGLLISKTKSH